MILQGHVLDKLAEIEAESVSCCVTSPPYWSLRKYEASDVVWGGEEGCKHEWTSTSKDGAVEAYAGAGRWQHADHSRAETPGDWGRVTQGSGLCQKCGAWRGQYGLEPTPELYVEHTLDVLRAIRRVLRPDGVVWWNIGDGYAGSGQGKGSDHGKAVFTDDDVPGRPATGTLKPKDLVLMPSRVALAAQADGWWVRSVIVWSKPNAMPESCKDRPTTAHEYVLMLTRSERYWYDQEAVREAYTESTVGRFSQPTLMEQQGGAKQADPLGPYQGGGNANKSHKIAQSLANHPTQGRNMRSVWEFPTAQTPEAHFATFPEELPRRCIEASCPREICAKCGTARVRVVEKTDEPDTRAKGSRFDAGKTGVNGEGRAQEGGRFLDTITGWTSCECADYQPGIVLDPFAGIGTTGVVAKRLGRRFIGIELSEKYAEMARAKLAMWWRRTELVAADTPPSQAVLPLAAATKEESCR